jgi:membrane protein implicated in regulation of membrane protease activity
MPRSDRHVERGASTVSPGIKYTLGRVGLFVVFAVALLPFHLNLFLALMIALLASMVLSYFLLKRWRQQLSSDIAQHVENRRAEKDRLRTALSGDDQDT